MANDESTTPAPTVWSTPTLSEVHYVEAHLHGTSGLQADPHRHAVVDIDGPPPPSGRDWLMDRGKRLAADPSSPVRVTNAARQIVKEMYEAFLRRQVSEVWGWPSIKNFLTKWKLWPSEKRRAR
jgi:hypothetical protein